MTPHQCLDHLPTRIQAEYDTAKLPELRHSNESQVKVKNFNATFYPEKNLHSY